MKTISHSIYLLGLIAIILYSCKECPDSKSVNLTHEDSLQICQDLNFTSPLIASEHYVLQKSAEFAFSVIDATEPTGFRYVKDIEMLFKLNEFETYIKKVGFNGIRFYPGLTESNDLVLIMCHANKENTTESDYVVLNNESSPNTFPQPSEDKAKALHSRYIEKTLIYFESQSILDSSFIAKLTFARFYTTAEVQLFVDQNLAETNAPHDQFMVRFAIGYIPNELSQRLIIRLGDTTITESQMQGFTVMLNLADSMGKDMIDLSAKPESNNYKGRYLEVGNPCPPRCGKLHPVN